MKYTLRLELSNGRKIAVASSNSLLKLCKIRKMTFSNGGPRFCIIETADKDDEFAFTYDEGCLFSDELEDFNRFKNKVDNGRYFPTYDYRQRAREHSLAKL